ncbi:MAG TPA: MaoC/PaaZ C-terminal domain-containing protein [Acidimicrobiales bacterium]|nr:MaoC/PaaZ C-terminal domain-containing protein [Acidimicrobiales bacterium]
MPADVLTIGHRMGPFAVVLDAALARAFARATQDDTPHYRDGAALPPTAIATRAYAAQLDSILELVPASLFAASRGGVHGQHDLLLQRAVVPGEPLRTTVELHSVKPSKDNVRVTLLHRTCDAQERLVAEQWWTTVLLGVTAEEAGPDLPETERVDGAREDPIAEVTVRIDQEMTRRYAEVSGDFSAHHFDPDAARQSGFEGPFLHGLCTMALCARAVVRTACPDDPSRLQRFAVRFASPAYVGQDLTVRLYALGQDRYALAATSGGAVAIRDGLAELRPAG